MRKIRKTQHQDSQHFLKLRIKINQQQLKQLRVNCFNFFSFRLLFHKGKSCYGELQHLDVNVVHEGDYYVLTPELIYPREADADNVVWKDLVLTKYENGEIISIKVLQLRFNILTFCQRVLMLLCLIIPLLQKNQDQKSLNLELELCHKAVFGSIEKVIQCRL